MSTAAHMDVPDLVPAADHIRGPHDAPVRIIEYGDFECPNCKQAAPTVALLLKRFAGRICVAYRHFPLEEVHPHALIAAEAAEAASEQGRFWEMHDRIFASQPHLQLPHLREMATELSLDMRRFSSALADHAHVAHIREDREGGQRSGVRATPTFFVNGKLCDVSFGMQVLVRAVEKALA